jgi:ankyrin repeat protein
MPFTEKVVVENSMVRILGVLLVCWAALALGWAAVAVAGSAEDLIDAAGRGDAAAVQALLAKGTDVNAKDSNGRTALIEASLYNDNSHVEVVRALLAKGADVNAKDRSGTTALIEASRRKSPRTAHGDPARSSGYAHKGNLQVVQALLAKGADVNAKGRNATTALIAASQGGFLEVVQALLANGADVNAKDSDGTTALMMASSFNGGFLDVVQALLAKGADVNVKDSDGATALIRAIHGDLDWRGHENGYRAVAQALLATKGVDINAKTNSGMTALMMACNSRDLEVVQALHAKGAGVNAKATDCTTALIAASRNGDKLYFQNCNDVTTKPSFRLLADYWKQHQQEAREASGPSNEFQPDLCFRLNDKEFLMTANPRDPGTLFYYCNFHGEGECSDFGMDGGYTLPNLGVDMEFMGPHGKRFVLMETDRLEHGFEQGEYYVLYLIPSHGGIPVETKALGGYGGLYGEGEGGCVPATAAELSEAGVPPDEIDTIVTSYHIENEGTDNVAIVFDIEEENCKLQTITKSTRKFVYQDGHIVGKAF